MINKYTLGLILLIVSFGGGYYSGKGNKEVQIQEKIVEIKGEKEIVVKDNIITVTKIVRPDGTVEETTKTEEKKTVEKSKEVSSEKDIVSISKPVLSNYSLGLKYWALAADESIVRDVSKPDRYELVLGRRIVGEVFLNASYRLDKQASIGVSINF